MLFNYLPVLGQWTSHQIQHLPVLLRLLRGLWDSVGVRVAEIVGVGVILPAVGRVIRPELTPSPVETVTKGVGVVERVGEPEVVGASLQ